MSKCVLCDAVFCLELSGVLHCRSSSAASASSSASGVCVALGSAMQVYQCWVWRSKLDFPRQGWCGLQARSREKWRGWRCWALLSSAHALDRQCHPSHPSPSPLPGPLGHCLLTWSQRAREPCGAMGSVCLWSTRGPAWARTIHKTCCGLYQPEEVWNLIILTHQLWWRK